MIDGKSIQIVDAAKCLGLLIDEHLSWSKKEQLFKSRAIMALVQI